MRYAVNLTAGQMGNHASNMFAQDTVKRLVISKQLMVSFWMNLSYSSFPCCGQAFL